MQLRPLLALSFALLGISAVACFAALSGAGAEKPTSVAAVDRQHPGSSVSDLRKKITSLIPGLLLVILSASSEVVDKVLLLEMGADDYVTILFSPREPVARLRGPITCVARRSGQLVCFEASCL
jgi:DNA-binding response OmpR family regulator